MRVQTPFEANYQVQIPPELPGDGKNVLYFPSRGSGAEHLYEAVLKFAYEGQKPWYGVFASRSRRGDGLTVVSTLLDPDCSCVSVEGTGYVLNVQHPPASTNIQIFPVKESLVVKDPELLVLSCFTRITAYGREGRKWTTDRLCSDQLHLMGSEGKWIKCVGWDASTSREVLRRVDSSSGQPEPSDRGGWRRHG